LGGVNADGHTHRGEGGGVTQAAEVGAGRGEQVQNEKGEDARGSASRVGGGGIVCVSAYFFCILVCMCRILDVC
jgi:hypothetical protein